MVVGYYQYSHGAAGERYNSAKTRASTITNTRMADNRGAANQCKRGTNISNSSYV